MISRRALGALAFAPALARADAPWSDRPVRAVVPFGPGGAIDILCNNAGVNLRGMLETITDETWHTQIATNLHSAFYCARAVAPAMIARGSGKIINLSLIHI